MANYKLVDADQLDNDLKLIANSIRQKTQTTEELSFPEDFSNAITEIGGAEAEQFNALINGSIKGSISSDVTELRSYAFGNCANLTSADFPLVTTIGQGAFQQCSSLTNANFPLATNVSDYLFRYCTNLTVVNIPLATNIGTYAFYECRNLASINSPKVTSINSHAFRNCTKLTSVDFSSVTSINSQAFQDCKNLSILTMRGTEKICTLSELSAFTGTPFASGGTGGTLLVPLVLLEEYKTATNWSTLYAYGTNHFLALEDYTTDGTTTGEIDWDELNSYLESLSIE